MRALIIEDEILVAFLLEEILRDIGYRDIILAGSEAEALAVPDRRAFDLVTADARLPDGCGITAAIEICREKPLPVVFVTGNVGAVYKRVRDPVVVEKPFTAHELTHAVELARAAPGLRPVSAGE